MILKVIVSSRSAYSFTKMSPSQNSTLIILAEESGKVSRRDPGGYSGGSFWQKNWHWINVE